MCGHQTFVVYLCVSECIYVYPRTCYPLAKTTVNVNYNNYSCGWPVRQRSFRS